MAQTVDQIRRLRDLIVKPPLATECLERRQIAVTAPRSPISGVLDTIRMHNYSQIPVYRGSAYVGLLTTNCIARWLADHLASAATLGDVNVQKIMRYAERDDRAMHVQGSATAAEASVYLRTPDTDGSRPRALIVTDTGASERPPVAVIVDYDLPAVVRRCHYPAERSPGGTSRSCVGGLRYFMLATPDRLHARPRRRGYCTPRRWWGFMAHSSSRSRASRRRAAARSANGLRRWSLILTASRKEMRRATRSAISASTAAEG